MILLLSLTFRCFSHLSPSKLFTFSAHSLSAIICVLTTWAFSCLISYMTPNSAFIKLPVQIVTHLRVRISLTLQWFLYCKENAILIHYHGPMQSSVYFIQFISCHPVLLQPHRPSFCSWNALNSLLFQGLCTYFLYLESLAPGIFMALSFSWF